MAGIAHVGALDIGGSTLRTALVDESGRILARHRVSLPPRPAPKRVIQVACELLARDERRLSLRVQGVGVAVPGPLDPDTGLVIDASNLGWRNVALPAVVHTQRPGIPVSVDDDARCAALGEACFGAGRGCAAFGLLIVGTGVGMGLVIAGGVYRGASGVAGEVGHLILRPGGASCSCGKRGCLETLIAGPHLVRRSHELGGTWADLPALLTAYDRGDPVARRTVDQAARWLGVGMAHITQVLNLDRVAIGGGAGLALWPLWRRRTEAVLDRRLAPVTRQAVTVVPALRGDDAGLLGAAQLVLDSLASPSR